MNVGQSKDSPEVLARVQQEFGRVAGIARRVTRTMGVNDALLDDVMGYGRLGLLKAARDFDPARGVSFRAFAGLRVEGAMLDGIRQMAPMPRRAHEKMRALENDSQDRAGAEQLLAGLNAARVNGVLPELGLDTQGELTAVEAGLSPEEVVEQRELAAVVERGLDCLPQQQARLVRGVLGGDQLETLAGELGLSKSAASRSKDRAAQYLNSRLQPETPELD